MGRTNDVTNASGTVQEVLQNFPNGSIGLDNTTSSFSGELRKYIGQQFDAATALSYLNARYYDGNRGQFISQDPVFLGNPNNQDLKNPQSLNSYSYAGNSPVGVGHCGTLRARSVSSLSREKG